MRRPVGRIRRRLAALLAEQGLIVDPADLWVQESGYRGRKWDLARWGSNHARWRDGIDQLTGKPYAYDIHLSSWSKMTDCVRHGISIGPDNPHWCVSVESRRP
jgi:hypothetical protein